MKRALLLAVLLFFIIGFSSQAMAYKLSNFSLQYRIYEDHKINRFVTEIQDDSGVAATDPSLLQNIQIFDPSGKEIVLTGKKAYLEPGKTAWYDLNMGQWMYPEALYNACMARAEFTTKLVSRGKYRIVVKYGGQRLAAYYTYNKAVNLPIMQSKFIKKQTTATGDLIVRWFAPPTLFTLTRNNPTLSTSARASISIYNGSQYVGYFQVKVGTHMEEAFFSKAFLNELKNMGGDNYKLMVTVRTNDNNNRSYSNEIPITLP